MSKPEVLLIDLSSLYWTAWHVTKDAPISEAASLAGAAVRRAVGLCENPLVAVCTDVGRSFRKDLMADYKANRPEKNQNAIAELERLMERLTKDGLWVVGATGFEADDVIATLATEASKREHPIVIASADKDLLQLLALPDSRQVRTHNNWDTWRAANVVEKFGVEPEGLGDWLALVGDSSDNVKGVPSVGPTTATKLLLQHFSLEELYVKIDALQVFQGQVETKTPAAAAIATPAIVDKLWRHKADAMLARKLVTLRTDAPVKFEDIYTKREVQPLLGDDMSDIISEGPGPESADPKGGDVPSAGSGVDANPPSGSAQQVATALAGDVAAGTSSASVQAPSSAHAETALVPVTVEYEHALEPRDPTGAVTVGRMLYDSRAFSRFPTPGSITATIMRGRELGISALAALDAFHFVAELGRILPSWQVIVTLAEQSPDCEYFRWVGGDDRSQTWETKHRKHSEATRLTYKIEQAERAGLVKPDKPKAAWTARPDEMLRKTAACQLARTVYPGATLGLYAPEEMGHET